MTFAPEINWTPCMLIDGLLDRINSQLNFISLSNTAKQNGQYITDVDNVKPKECIPDNLI